MNGRTLFTTERRRKPALRFASAAASGLAALILLLAVAPSVRAGTVGDELHLTWNDCWTGGGALPGASFLCDLNTGADELIIAFRLGADADSIIALEAVVDVQLAAATLPDWWMFGTGGCREGALTADAAATGTSCTPAWGGAGFALVSDYQPGQPRGGAAQARIRAVVAVPSDSARHLVAGQPYTGLRLLLGHQKSTSLGACTGCTTAACLVLNSIWLKRIPGGSGDLFIESTALPGDNEATWQGSSADCSAVPVRRTTWGRLKGFYR